MKLKIGLSPEEMIDLYNQTFLEIWEEIRENIDWSESNLDKYIKEGKQVDISKFVLQLVEASLTAARDAIVVTISENNNRVIQNLQEYGIFSPDKQSLLQEEEFFHQEQEIRNNE